MLFDPTKGAAKRQAVAAAAGAIVFALCILGGVAFVAVHFITKFW